MSDNANKYNANSVTTKKSNTKNHVDQTKIPCGLLNRTIDLLENIDISRYDIFVRQDYHEVYMSLLTKQYSIEMRHAYAAIIYAEDEDARTEARIRYLALKQARDFY